MATTIARGTQTGLNLSPGLLAWLGLVGLLLAVGIVSAITGFLERPGASRT